MTTQELKEQARKEFDERFEYMSGGYYASRMGRHAVHPDDFKSFLDSLIDKTVQATEERIVGVVDNVELNVFDRQINNEVVEFYKDAVEETKRIIKSFITNKSNVNK